MSACRCSTSARCASSRFRQPRTIVHVFSVCFWHHSNRLHLWHRVDPLLEYYVFVQPTDGWVMFEALAMPWELI